MYGVERFAFDDSAVPTWRAIEQRMLSLHKGRLRLREAGRSAKALVDVDHPHTRVATLVFLPDSVDVYATWPKLDLLITELAALGGTRVSPARLSRLVEGTVDYFSVYDDGLGGWAITSEMKHEDRFLMWKGFAASVADAMAVVGAELVHAWDVACYETAPADARRECARAVAGWRDIERAVLPPTSSGAYADHEHACAADFGRWLAQVGREGVGFHIEDVDGQGWVTPRDDA